MTTDSAGSGVLPLSNANEKAAIHHIAFKVAFEEFDELIDWYRNVLDMDVNFRGKQIDLEVCFLANDRANHRLVFVTRPGIERDPTYRGRARLDHSAFEFATIDGLLEKYAALRDQGIHPYMSIDHGLTLSLYYRDPTGHGVELQTDAHGDWSSSKQWMHVASEFAANPAGILFDPDRVIEARNAGASLDELHRRIYDDGEFPPRPEQRARLQMPPEKEPYLWDHSSWGPDHPTFDRRLGDR
ncbi:VOC family protein [Streptomyces sp. AS58]|uniref:VOC family protein n=1 Tax=Streptomyces sp. AS58 TaxID=1519489 RepID=UPI0006AE704C|nr:VOC family protein [Streptomyces sp. AS58]